MLTLPYFHANSAQKSDSQSRPHPFANLVPSRLYRPVDNRMSVTSKKPILPRHPRHWRDPCESWKEPNPKETTFVVNYARRRTRVTENTNTQSQFAVTILASSLLVPILVSCPSCSSSMCPGILRSFAGAVVAPAVARGTRRPNN